MNKSLKTIIILFGLLFTTEKMSCAEKPTWQFVEDSGIWEHGQADSVDFSYKSSIQLKNGQIVKASHIIEKDAVGFPKLIGVHIEFEESDEIAGSKHRLLKHVLQPNKGDRRTFLEMPNGRLCIFTKKMTTNAVYSYLLNLVQPSNLEQGDEGKE